MKKIDDLFENDVKMYGIQTRIIWIKCRHEFENDVKTYGIQTMMTGNITNMTFENDVKMHGIQTTGWADSVRLRLRMM